MALFDGPESYSGHSEEARAKMRAAWTPERRRRNADHIRALIRKGALHSAEARAKSSARMKGPNAPRRHPA